MSSLTNVNNNAAVVVVGRTAPVPAGQQTASKSIPVVLASDQSPVPVIEQNKIQSEVALSLLGIPRSEVALGIFADVNTYDVNPTEWASTPQIRQDVTSASEPAYANFGGVQGWGLKHVPQESGALIEAPADKVSVLTSKRFFRYQPGRVSSATFGIKTSVIPGDPNGDVRNPAIRKYGSFDNFDGYYWETRDTGKGDQLVVVRRTTSLINENPLEFGIDQTDDSGIIGSEPTAETPAGVAGDLVVLRDGLVHVHAAVYDPSLLKEETLHTIDNIAGGTTLTLTVSEGLLNVGQHVTYETSQTNPITNLVKQRIYKVLTRNYTAPAATYTITLAQVDSSVAIASLGSVTGTHSLKTPVPFLFPVLGGAGTGDIMWPLARDFTLERVALGAAIGFVNTAAIDISTTKADIDKIIDGTTYPLESHWASWILWNVKPEFYRVYEFRVPRSRFSGDFLDGVGGTDAHQVYYSDVVRTGAGNDTVKRPGQAVQDEAAGVDLTTDSIWNLDFGKVTMQKIEFSWYGAVGALFLAYVPVSNGEARWIRVHHLRCSNQLKVSSLGNPTLPITYLVYGGGSETRYGYSNAEGLGKRRQSEFGTFSQFIVKYGASYYIDGGDRGTVRLYSYSSPTGAEVYGSKYRMRTSSVTGGNDPYLTINEASPYNSNPVVSDFYMGATVITTDAVDQGIKVVWVDGPNKRLHLNKPLNSLTGVVRLDVLVDRPQIIYGVETKTEIISSQGSRVRNRVQAYPTRLASGAGGSGTVSLQLRKNPIFQSFDVFSGNAILDEGFVHILRPQSQPTSLTAATVPTTMAIGAAVYGWFRGFFTDDSNQKMFAVLGILRRVAASTYTFTATDSYSRQVRITGSFLYAENYDNDGTITPSSYRPSKTELERLSSIQVVDDVRTPIPGTGKQITSFYISQGGEQFDLSAYFDYNKDYLSFPLTNEIDSLFLTCTSVDRYINIDGIGDPESSTTTLRLSVLASLTWEEQ